MTQSIINDIKDYYSENLGQNLTDEQVKQLDTHDKLTAFLGWNGIFGYTADIESIFERD